MTDETFAERMKRNGLSITPAFTVHDISRLVATTTDEELKHEYKAIGDEIHRVLKANLSINHSNY